MLKAMAIKAEAIDHSAAALPSGRPCDCSAAGEAGVATPKAVEAGAHCSNAIALLHPQLNRSGDEGFPFQHKPRRGEQGQFINRERHQRHGNG